MRELTYAEAIREALREEMLRDERVFILGEDVGALGGIFTVVKGLIEEFGPERVRDTPISETAIIGAAIGSALTGMKPVAEIMYMDFLNVCMDQLVNHAPKMRFITGGTLKVPIVVRTQCSLGRMLGAQHSQFFPSWFMHVPGMKVVVPSTPYDAKGLLKTAIRDENPVLFIEFGNLYFRKGHVPNEEYLIPFGEGDVKRRGEDVTVVAISSMVHEALAAAQRLEKEGVSVEVVDPRTLTPLDKKTIIESVKKTGRALIAEASCKTCGVGAEISATLIEEAFDYLDAPILRIAVSDTPAPYSPGLQDYYIPNQEKIIDTIKRIV